MPSMFKMTKSEVTEDESHSFWTAPRDVSLNSVAQEQEEELLSAEDLKVGVQRNGSICVLGV